ncbi:hypothetical protein FF38_00220 [Lucilia cuprina]|uniref:Uncharacterized protein n=1 Tax=Lucilia cuprina TaxID=7375 RepID=A0A0L0C845_LUCCU|nr:hypothetical protein FF38_00220 [Lucilia cuprina]
MIVLRGKVNRQPIDNEEIAKGLCLFLKYPLSCLQRAHYSDHCLHPRLQRLHPCRKMKKSQPDMKLTFLFTKELENFQGTAANYEDFHYVEPSGWILVQLCMYNVHTHTHNVACIQSFGESVIFLQLVRCHVHIPTPLGELPFPIVFFLIKLNFVLFERNNAADLYLLMIDVFRTKTLECRKTIDIAGPLH